MRKTLFLFVFSFMVLNTWAGDNIITFADANVKAICVANWDTNGDGELSHEEAAAVTSLGEVFHANYGITSFDELQYFTGLTAIPQFAFRWCKNLHSIILPNNVRVIEYCAFEQCQSLASVSFPSNIETLAPSVFNNCISLTSVFIPKTITEIGWSPFGACKELNSIIVEDGNPNYDSRNNCNAIMETATNKLISGCKNTIIPEETVEIGGNAFFNVGFNYVPFSENLTTIRHHAFSFSKGSTLIIPASVTTIESSAFEGCEELTTIIVDENNPVYDSRENCNALIATNSNTLITGCINTNIPNSVERIDPWAFTGDILSSVILPAGIISIEGSPFGEGSNLESVTIKRTEPISISSATFPHRSNATLYVPAGCKAAYEAADYWKDFKEIVEMEAPSTNITFADVNVKAICIANWDTNGDGELSHEEAAAVTSLGEVFKENTEITSFNELQYFLGQTTIDDYAFYNCSSLSSVTLPQSLMDIGKFSFGGCNNLSSIIIPRGVKSIGNNAFEGCSILPSITIPSNVVSIGRNAFTSTHMASIVVEEGNTTYDSRENCNAIIERASNRLILGCKNTTIPLSVTSIGNEAFSGRGDLTSIIIPSSVRTIEFAAFFNCPGLTTIRIYATIPLSIEGSTFYNCTNATLYVPFGTKAAYEAADYWKDFKEIVEMEAPSTNITFADVNVKAICVANWDTNGDGELSHEEAAAVTSLGEVFKGNTEITSFDELQYFTGLTSIGSHAFWNSGLSSIIIPSSVASIGDWAFGYLGGLTSVIIPASVTTINEFAFEFCSGLTSLVVETGNSVYDSRESCNAIIRTVDNVLITGCQNTIIPNSVTSIGRFAFSGCSGLNSVTIPNSVTFIDYAAFNCCSGLTSATIPNSVTSIESYAFTCCSYLTSVTIPNSVTSIGNSAFSDCSSLTNVKVDRDMPPSISSSTFSNSANATLYVPAGCKAAYEAAEYWNEFKEIIEDIELIPGDVNSDNAVDVSDYLTIANYILGQAPTTFNEAAADVTQDDNVDVADYLGVANIILYGNYQGPQANNANAIKALTTEQASPWMEMEVTEDGLVELHLHDTPTFSAFQMDIFLPEGIEIYEVNMSKAKQTRNLSYAQLQSGAWRLLYGTLESKTVNLADRSLLTLKLTSKNKEVFGGIDIEDITLVKPNSSAIHLSNVHGLLPTGISDIEGMMPTENNNYDLTGRKVTESHLKKGIYIINGKKFLLSK